THASDLRTVALSGQTTPTASEGDVSFGGFRIPALNDAGLVAFTGYFNSASDFAVSGIWSEQASGLSLSAAGHHQAPGMPAGFLFQDTSLELLGFSNAAKTLFLGSVSNDGGNTARYGYWSERTGSPTLLALSGNQSPGEPNGVNFTQIYES